MKRVVLRTASLIRQTAPAPRIQSPNIPIQRPLSRAYNRHSSFRRFHSQQAAETAKACPSCGAPLNLTEISCKTCNALSPLPENVNYLSLFGFPATSYDIDLRKLKSEYLKLMSKVHPDSVIHKSEDQKRIADNVSSTITHAYSTLLRPLSRATYLLQHMNPPVMVEETSKLSDPELLMTVLEVREAIEEAETQDEVEGIKRENGARIERVEEKLRRAFEEGRGEDARDRTVELRYWEGLKKACDDWEPGKRVELVHE